jgi:glucose/mannose-6-phosphate isomerase
MAFPYLTVPPLVLLSRLGLQVVSEMDLQMTAKELQKQRTEYVAQLFGDSLVKQLSMRLINRIVITYGAGPMATVAYRFKCQLNENSKMLAWSGVNPEICHNEIVGWERPPTTPITAVLFRDQDDLDHVKVRSDLIQEYLQARNMDVLEITGNGQSRYSRIMTATYLGDWVSYYLAIQQGINPASTDTIIWLKTELQKRLGNPK